MPKLPSFLGIRRGLSSAGQNEIKDEKTEESLNDHVEIDFSASTPAQINNSPPTTNNGPSTNIESNENGKKQGAEKPQSKVSPFTNMHHKLNFIPHSQRDRLNAQFLATLPGVLKMAELVSLLLSSVFDKI